MGLVIRRENVVERKESKGSRGHCGIQDEWGIIDHKTHLVSDGTGYERKE